MIRVIRDIMPARVIAPAEFASMPDSLQGGRHGAQLHSNGFRSDRVFCAPFTARKIQKKGKLLSGLFSHSGRSSTSVGAEQLPEIVQE
jgi:hypothetical protein